MNPYSLPLLCFSFCSFLLGLFIWFKRNDFIGRIYFVFTFFISLWGLFFGICWGYNDISDKSLFLLRISDVFAIFIPPTWLHFVFAYTERKNKGKILAGLYGLSFSLSIFSFSKFFIPAIKMTSLNLVFVVPGLIFKIFTVYFSSVVFFGFLFLIIKMNHTHPKEKKQLLGFIFATSLGFIGGSLTFLPVYGIPLPQYGLFLLPVYPFVISYFLMRHGLFARLSPYPL